MKVANMELCFFGGLFLNIAAFIRIRHVDLFKDVMSSLSAYIALLCHLILKA